MNVSANITPQMRRFDELSLYPISSVKSKEKQGWFIIGLTLFRRVKNKSASAVAREANGRMGEWANERMGE